MRSPHLAVALAAALLSTSCALYQKGTLHEELNLKPVDKSTVNGKDPVLKAHMDDGDVYVLREWKVKGNRVRGKGVKFDPRRKVDNRGIYEIPVDDVAMFETNVLRPSGGIIAMTVISGLSAALSGFCLVNPKACFGSCPTFYAGSGPVAERRPGAEGFSRAVAPSLETSDVDKLGGLDPSNSPATVRMTNEAMETHVVRRLELLAVEKPGPEFERVLQRPEGSFHGVGDGRAPASCSARNGDCTDALARRDGDRWSSEADAEDLTARETVELTYEGPVEGRLGLELSFRQSFVTTFLFYQFLSDLGEKAVDFLAHFERTSERNFRWFQKVQDLMGGIEVQARVDGEWATIREVFEAGPIADNSRLVVLPKSTGGDVPVRLRLARGNWRLDAARLVEVGPRADVEHLELRSATYDGANPEAAQGRPAERVGTMEDQLSTRPGDAYEFRFGLPDRPDEYEYFVKSRGYYLEWIREKWRRERRPARAAEMLFWPARALRTLAPEFKERESQIEETFWESRYVPSE